MGPGLERPSVSGNPAERLPGVFTLVGRWGVLKAASCNRLRSIGCLFPSKPDTEHHDSGHVSYA